MAMRNMIIVGSQGAIGNHVAQAFASKYVVHGTYHTNIVSPSRLHDKLHRVDVRSFMNCQDFVNAIRDKLDSVILINAAGISVDSIAHRTNPENWLRVLSTNLCGVFNMCRAVLPIMRKKGWGRIINLSSVVGHVGVPGTAAYATSKAGLEGLTRTLAVESAARNITVNALVLGYMSVGLINSVPERERAMIHQSIPARHFGHPDNVVNAIQFLIDSEYVTGASIPIDGGFLCT